MMRVLPGRRIDRLDVTHPIFNMFLLDQVARKFPTRQPRRKGLMGEFYGIHEDNDPDKRLKVDHQLQHGHRRLHGMVGRRASTNSPPTNEAYKLMINYVIYGLTH